MGFSELKPSITDSAPHLGPVDRMESSRQNLKIKRVGQCGNFVKKYGGDEIVHISGCTSQESGKGLN